MRKSEVLAVYEILKAAKVTKMEDADKFKVIKYLKNLKSIATEFDDFKKEALEKLKEENHEEMVNKAQQWQSEGEVSTLSTEEKAELNKYFNTYNNKVVECIKEEADKEVEITIDKLSEEAYKKLLISNDWSTEQALVIYETYV